MFKTLLVSNERMSTILLEKFEDAQYKEVDVLSWDQLNLNSENFIPYQAIWFQMAYPLFPEYFKVLQTVRNVFPGIIVVLDQYDFYKNRYFCDSQQIDLYYPLIEGIEGCLGRCKSLIIDKFLGSHGNIEYKDVTLDLGTRSCQRGEQKIKLRFREFELLRFLLENPGKVFSPDQLLEFVWDMNSNLNTNTVQSHISFLRKKIDADFDDKLLHTIACVGYKIE